MSPAKRMPPAYACGCTSLLVMPAVHSLLPVALLTVYPAEGNAGLQLHDWTTCTTDL